MWEIMKIIHERGMQKNKTKQKSKQIKTEKNKGDRSYSERVRAKLLSCAFKLAFHQLICKDSWIFKSNLELVLSIILKQKELYESKHAAVECRWDLLSFLICSSNLVLKWQQVLPNSPQLQLKYVNLYTRKDFKY